MRERYTPLQEVDRACKQAIKCALAFHNDLNLLLKTYGYRPLTRALGVNSASIWYWLKTHTLPRDPIIYHTILLLAQSLKEAPQKANLTGPIGARAPISLSSPSTSTQ